MNLERAKLNYENAKKVLEEASRAAANCKKVLVAEMENAHGLKSRETKLRHIETGEVFFFSSIDTRRVTNEDPWIYVFKIKKDDTPYAAATQGYHLSNYEIVK